MIFLTRWDLMLLSQELITTMITGTGETGDGFTMLKIRKTTTRLKAVAINAKIHRYQNAANSIEFHYLVKLSKIMRFFLQKINEYIVKI